MPSPPSQRQTVPASTQGVSPVSTKQPCPQRRPAAAPQGSRDAESAALSHGVGRMTLATQPHNNQTTNVVLFGEPGVGKSSVVNLIARGSIARVSESSGVHSCALQFTCYDISIDDTNFCVFETSGIEKPEIRANDYLAALERAHKFVSKLSAAGGVHLLLFCVRAAMLTPATRSNYQLLSEVVFPTKVPMTLVVTGLEGESSMEDWWTKNKTVVERHGLKSDSHACVAAVTDHTRPQDRNYAESQKRIRELLKTRCLKTAASLPDPRDWFLRLGKDMQQFIEKEPKPTRRDITNTLTMRLKLDPKTVQEFLDMMDAQASGGSASRSQDATCVKTARQPGESKREAEPPESDKTLTFRHPNAGKDGGGPRMTSVVETFVGGRVVDPGKRDNEPSRGATVEVGTSQSQPRYSNTTERRMKDGRWDDGALTGETTAVKVKVEPRKVNTPAKTSVGTEMGISVEDIRSNFPPDLTGHVTKTKEFAFASGGYGDIYTGRLSMKGKSANVAIKVYRMYLQHEENLQDRMKRFNREVGVWLNLQHPNVLPLFGTIRDPSIHPDMPAMVCPWIENGALSGYLKRNKNLTIVNRLSLVNDVAHGLQYLHSQYVIHGDLSGSNVLVGVDGGACIADFGLSTSLTAISGRTSTNKGTVRWMAPALLNFEGPHTTPSMQSDVYSFGSIMLQVLTGDVPYHHLSNDVQVIAAIVKGVRPDRSKQESVTDARWKFIERCWSVYRPRPSSDEIVEFTRRELAESMALGPSRG